MAEGSERREVTGALPPVQADLTVGLQRTGGIQQVNPTQSSGSSYNDRLYDQLAKFGSQRAKATANARYKKEFLDGQMAQQQGAALSDTQFKGKEWAMQGWRVMEAQQTVAAMHAAQKAEIAQIGYQQTPEEFRKNWNARLAQALEGQDVAVADMITEAAMQSMPDLVADHTAQHSRWSEEQNFNALKDTVVVTAQAPGAVETYVGLATGTGPSAGMSTERRQQALYEGARDALLKGDIAPWLIINSDDRIKDAMDAGQFAELRNHVKAYDARKREELDLNYIEQETGIMQRAANGDYPDAQAAVDELVALQEQYNVKTTTQELSVVHGAVTRGRDDRARTMAADIEAYAASGDMATVARMGGLVIQDIESGGGRNVVGQPVGASADHAAGDRAFGNWQVMPSTARQPSLPAWERTGFKGKRIEPAKDNSIAEYNRVGQEYWSGLVEMFNGDVEAAGLAHHSGFGTAQRWVEGGKLQSFFEGRPNGLDYVRKIRERIGGTMTQEMWRARSAAVVERAQKDHEVRVYEQYAPQLDQIRDQVVNRGMPFEQGVAQLREIQEELGMARTKDSVDTELDILDDLRRTTTAALKTQQSDVNNTFEAQASLMDAQFEENYALQVEAINEGRAEPSSLPALVTSYIEERHAAAAEAGVMLSSSQLATEAKESMTKVREARATARDSALDAQEIAMAESRIGAYDALTPTQQERGYTMQHNRVLKEAEEMVANGTLQEGGRGDWIGQQMNAWTARTGYFSKDAKAHASGVINGRLIDDEAAGTPNPQALALLNTYMEMRGTNPVIGDRMFSSERDKVRADTIIDLAGGSQQNLATAMLSVHLDGQDLPKQAEELRKAMNSPEMQSRVNDAVKGVLKNDEFYTMLGVPLMRRPGRGASDDSSAQAQLRPVVENEMRRLLLVNPTGKPEWLAQQATKNVQQRTATLGGELVIAPPGMTINSMVFGSDMVEDPNAGVKALEAEIQRMANQTTEDGDPLIPYLRVEPTVTGTLATHLTPGRGALSAMERAADPTLLIEDFTRTELRPYTSIISPDGNLYITFDQGEGGFLGINQDFRGPAEPIAIDMKAAGEAWKAAQ